MEFFEVVKKRHCCRSFQPDKKVSNDLIEKIIAAGKAAPSAGGIYPVEFSVVKDDKTKEELAEAAQGQDFIINASVILVIWADVEKTAAKYGERGRALYTIQDAAVAAENIFLAVTALKLDACWLGAFDENEVKKILHLSAHQRPMVIMPLGQRSLQ